MICNEIVFYVYFVKSGLGIVCVRFVVHNKLII
jgi:hypothetical protein